MREFTHPINNKLFSKWLVIKKKNKITDVMIAEHLGLHRVSISRIFNSQMTTKPLEIKINDYLTNYGKVPNKPKNEVLTDNN